MAITHSLLIRLTIPTEVVTHRNRNRILLTPDHGRVTAADHATLDNLPDAAGIFTSDTDIAALEGAIERHGSADVI